jgi:hypothetical protein
MASATPFAATAGVDASRIAATAVVLMPAQHGCA